MSNPLQLLVATRKGLFTLQPDSSGAWVPVRHDFVGDPVSLVCTDPRDGTRYAALDLGHFGPKLHRMDPGASEWQEVACPAYEESDDAAVKQIWALEAGGADQPGRMWAGTIPGGLFRSDDRGESWQLLRSLWDHPEREQWFGGGSDEPAIHSICVHPQRSAEVLLGVSCGGAWLTEDDGASWKQVGQGMRAAYLPEENAFDPTTQDPHCIVRCPSAPETLWTQHHNGIFRKTGDEDWVEITTAPVSSFGFACAVHPDDPNRVWFVPAVKDDCRVPADARVVVQHTRDGGRSFEVQTEGLPQNHAFDLVLRHALDIDGSGNRLAFGSTTGGLWVTENEGAQWHQLPLRLPPVYAVRYTG